ncbi:50S ribosomal protein L13 [Apibacter adventoris]|uniref:Large ribosomal subunit protein uL13 n=1 Tax=Apibacter adventoris TaxID=1679466 RepID=A0A2S8AE03_9FLAO|nr:50S ribosomal protein L13 [Apibacter adventoris]PQL93186.1 50S ribosomal protein L13 [Apibacter adventoris]PQL95880.1 50S ribosomal protein L13 [Apibacter adventoris]
MNTLSYKTVSANKETANKEWLLVDAEGQRLGRLASKLAKILRGKHKTNFTPHADCGDNVIVINAEKVVLSGNKNEQKEYIRYTGYPGGQRFSSVSDVKAKDPKRLLEFAVRGMLPKNKLGRKILNNLYLYEGTEHEQSAQQPKSLDINTFI